MSTSFQAIPPPGPLPPGMIYPTTTTTSTGTSRGQDSTSHSSGSFVMVFVVLAVILVVSAIACILGRFCTKKSNKSHHSKTHKYSHNHGYNHNHNHNQMNNYKHGGPHLKDRDLEFGYRSREGDIMHGFDPKTRIMSSSAKVANNGDFRGDGFGSGRGMEHDGMPRDYP